MTDEQLTERCARAGLRLRGVQRRGPVLLLVPDTTVDLPPPAELRALAAELQVDEDVRWVALELEEPHDVD